MFFLILSVFALVLALLDFFAIRILATRLRELEKKFYFDILKEDQSL